MLIANVSCGSFKSVLRRLRQVEGKHPPGYGGRMNAAIGRPIGNESLHTLCCEGRSELTHSTLGPLWPSNKTARPNGNVVGLSLRPRSSTEGRFAVSRRKLICWESIRSSDLPDRGKIEIAAGRIFSDPNCRFVDEVVWWNWQVVRRGHTIEYSSRQIVFRAMTGTKISAQPIRGGL
jgi:hypothetical protein